MKHFVITMTATITNNPTLTSTCRFFAEYASYMLGCGATCIRIDRNMARMAQCIGTTADMTILPSHILLTLTDNASGKSASHSCSIARIPVNYDMNTRLSKLSWMVAEGRVSISDAAEMFHHIVHARTANPWIVMCVVVLANASFCRLFGGDAASMLLVAFATMVGYSLKNIMLAQHADLKLTFLTCAFVSATIGAGAYIFGIGDTPDVALGTSVLYLIPGIPYINSVSDMLDGHYLCAFSRFAHATILTACIALGLTGGILIMNLNVF